MKPFLTAIVAVSKDNKIGTGTGMPWPKLKEDLQHFKELTTGNVVIMGRRTYESIGKPLPNRTNLVITHNQNIHEQDTYTYNVIDDLIEDIYRIHLLNPETKYFVIGGAQIYRQLLKYCDTIILTKIAESYPEASVEFPTIPEDFEIETFGIPQVSENGTKFRYITYKRY